jgi:hypothetical protein
MELETVTRVETAVDGAASASFAAAVGSAAYAVLSGRASGSSLGAETAVAAAAALLIAYNLLRRVQPQTRAAPVPIFDVREIEAVAESAPAEEPLLLDDILAELGPDSRVVRLFDRAAMPTPGELKARIDRHLEFDGGSAQPANASEALHDALAELRRSLR